MDLQPEQSAVPTGRISRAYFSASIDEFLEFPPTQIIGRLTDASEFSVDLAQRDAWNDQIRLLKESLPAKPPEVASLLGRLREAAESACGIETAQGKAMSAYQAALQRWRREAKESRAGEATAWERMQATVAAAPLTRRRQSNPVTVRHPVPWISPPAGPMRTKPRAP